MRKPLALLGVSAVVGFGVLALGGPAFAADHYPTSDWHVVYTNYSNAEKVAKPSSINATNVELVGKGTDAPPHYGVSVETGNLNITGDKVSVDYALSDDASFASGAVRLFVYNKTNADTMNEAPDKSIAAVSKTGTLTLDAGFKIGTMGLVYDSSNSKAAGKVTFTNLKVDDTKVLFVKPVVVTPTPTPTATKPAPKSCEAYLYTGTTENLCGDFANATKLNCTQAKWRVTLVNKANDPWGLDANGSGTPGIGCESNPLKPKASATPTHTATTTKTPAAGLPVTGDKGPGKLIAIGAAALVLGAAGIVVVRKRRDTKFVAE